MEDQTEISPPVRVKNATLQRGLTNRHIQLIAIGGAIGTGLFMGSGKTISLAGPSIIFCLYDNWLCIVLCNESHGRAAIIEFRI